MSLGQKLSIAVVAAGAISVLLCVVAWLPGEIHTQAMVAAAAEATMTLDLPTPTTLLPVEVEQVLKDYIEVTDSCGPHFDGECVNVRKGPGEEYPSVAKLRAGAVLQTSDSIEKDGHIWYKIIFDEWLRFPDRTGKELYIAADYVRPFKDVGRVDYVAGTTASTSKYIIVDRSEQKLYAYDGDVLFMEQKVSTGLQLTPTPRGTFTVYAKTPTRYMQGPLPGVSDQYYDLPGVPWDLYFTDQGGAIHGAYWHDSFGKRWSHGCVNLPPEKAREIYEWADLGTKVIVRD